MPNELQIQVNSDNTVSVDQQLSDEVTSTVLDAVERFGNRLTRIEVHLNDMNSHKSGSQDKRCQIEARPAGLDPVSVSNNAPTIEEAVRGAAQKLQRMLDTTFGRLADRR